jgi:hypothetical protein
MQWYVGFGHHIFSGTSMTNVQAEGEEEQGYAGSTGPFIISLGKKEDEGPEGHVEG